MRAVVSHGGGVPAPLSLGFTDCLALVLSAALLAVSALWPQRPRG